ncbi:phosphotransferase [Streptomyces bohaiensis]|uniref:Phosphotransferase n=1 Tax=Streptomyces bohaiensis TaxID=1431344 RepID=A0ABX1C797_9ACTN|nr:phosphotransferase [Streptomyces bohaiensis]NJQ15046.1 phosphotransferase [Streptomyces bohaiensis]
MDRGELIGSGRSADVFALDHDWVLRRYRADHDATREASVMAHLAQHGYPVPRVRQLSPENRERLRRTDLVLQRLHGLSMRQALRQGEITPAEAGATLADLLSRLHRVPPRSPDSPGDRVLHLDLHPDNVMLTDDGPVVIDWHNTLEGPPGIDWGMSALILAEVALRAGDWTDKARAALAALLRRQRRVAPDVMLDATGAGWLSQARDWRALDPATGEGGASALDDAVRLVLALLPPSPP